MENNPAENLLVYRQYNVPLDSYYEEEIKIIIDNLTIEGLSPDELLKRKLEFEREAIPYIKLFFHYALKISGNPNDAYDMLQDTYVLAFRFFDKLEEGTNCRIWLGRIMRNCYINRYRKNILKKQQKMSLYES
ncbi:MAG: hypothetical protein JW917_04085 [Ignavibacteria bacterium]|nr:hypothetical protein [Ignavibacteria bacterium]